MCVCVCVFHHLSFLFLHVSPVHILKAFSIVVPQTISTFSPFVCISGEKADQSDIQSVSDVQLGF